MVKRFFKKMFGARHDGVLDKTADTKAAPESPVEQHSAGTFSPLTLPERAFEVTGIVFEACPGAKAFARWKQIKADGDVHPVITGSPEDLEDLLGRFQGLHNAPSNDIDPETLTFPTGFLQHKEAEASGYYDVPEDAFNLEKAVDDILEHWTDTPYEDPQDEPTVIRDHRGKYHATVYIARVPTDDWTDIAARLRFGGWNDCPSDDWHQAAFRHWHKQYGAELLSMTADIIEMQVKYRPQMLRDAVALAMEQFYYCSDIVTQGVNEPANLAKLLMQKNLWYFWWD